MLIVDTTPEALLMRLRAYVPSGGSKWIDRAQR